MPTVTKHAIIKRINRRLAAADRRLRVCRGQHARLDLGDHYVVDVNRNVVVGTHVDVEAYARELGVLAKWEILSEG